MEMFKRKPVSVTLKSSIENDLFQFLSNTYQIINVARLQHLDSLGLSMQYKKVVDLGAGVGDHTLYYLFKNCNVLPIEGRSHLVDFIANRFNIESVKIDFETEGNRLTTI